MDLNREGVLSVLRLTKWWHADYDKREIDVFFSDGYNVESNRTAFFCVKGSPNKFFGFVESCGTVGVMGTTDHGKFWCSGSKVTYRN